ncbi:phospho-N-acetylmuramoyl-pentapeptide-transferase [Populus alba x Populus x berolinensis]|nr:phospho-N-acetylmuramoyl-pentapeptide-transferase [Populus alba x Populus x berolinensis]
MGAILITNYQVQAHVLCLRIVMLSINHHHHLSRIRLSRPPKHFSSSPLYSNSFHNFKLNGSSAGGRRLRHKIVQVRAFDEDLSGVSSPLDDWANNDGAAGYVLLSSDGEDSDGEYIINPVTDMELPTAKVSTNDALTLTAHRLAMIGRAPRKRRQVFCIVTQNETLMVYMDFRDCAKMGLRSLLCLKCLVVAGFIVLGPLILFDVFFTVPYLGIKTQNKLGTLINLCLLAFLTVLLLFVDWCAWKIVRLPLEPFYLCRPFFISAVLVSFLGYLCVPLLGELRIHQNIWKEGPLRRSKKRASPTMGGLFFVPIGVGVAKFVAGFSSVEVSGTAVATLAFATIGLLDDIVTVIKNQNSGLSLWVKIFLEVAVGTCFSFWLHTTSISSPYSMKMLVALPAPLGLICLGKYYSLFTSFCFVSMGNGINLTDGLDGLAAGTAALAFVGMSIAVLPICPEVKTGKGNLLSNGNYKHYACSGIQFLPFLLLFLLYASAFDFAFPVQEFLIFVVGETRFMAILYVEESVRLLMRDEFMELAVFGASMAGACFGFLLHNRYKASVFMGDTGSLALGGALAAMAACSGMFLPLFISSGIFFLDASSVIIQVLFFKTTKRMRGDGRRLFRMAPIHHHLELCGLKEPVIVAGAYVISGLLALFAGYVGLISA